MTNRIKEYNIDLLLIKQLTMTTLGEQMSYVFEEIMGHSIHKVDLVDTENVGTLDAFDEYGRFKQPKHRFVKTQDPCINEFEQTGLAGTLFDNENDGRFIDNANFI